MQLRSVIALGLTTTFLTTTTPVRARETEAAPLPLPAPVTIEERAPDILALTSEVLGSRPQRLAAPARSLLAARPDFDEVRLSRGAKTAIIVGAIVVGVLIIVGVVAVGKPHKHL